ncbi:mRNA-decapping enzyme 1B [Cimex lectularius]|uniref:mRNA-decapping enzyme C-terminal domain-containing protein n=1 Tax=Cimex lectularius TaxID=79782 RepID=A0A8I6RBV0_CIMLE|nr:mRNA-decapping enzyme 1B [Cimex lectularius]
MHSQNYQTRQVKMAKAAETSMNVSALKLADPLVKEILDTAAHVALYNFNSELQEWEKTNIEGALFIYSRTGEPKYNAFVLNRLSTFNLIEPVDEGLDIQLQEPFLLYRNSIGSIHGIWFYDRDECVRIANAVEKLVMEQKSSNSCKSEGKSSPSGVEGANPRVMDFFAKASNKTPSQSVAGPFGGGPRPPQNTKQPDVNPILQRLMSGSNPLHVQDIEKQHSIRKLKKDERPVSLPIRQQKLENGISYMRISESPPKARQHFFNSPSSLENQPLEVSELERNVASIQTPCKPALLPPGMFTSTVSSVKEDPKVQPEPLTKSQLIQAVTYLLKNDADFVKKLHEAYVKSFVDMVS